MPRRRPAPDGLFLTPGASANRDHHTLVALEAGLAPLEVERWDFPYIRAGRKAPDRAPVLIASVEEGMRAFANRLSSNTRKVLAGGRSMGGRMCSLAVAEGLSVAGLVLISYPLHPPGKPDKLRTDHFDQLRVPCLFVSGTRDQFGSPDEIEAATTAIPGPVTHVWIEGGDHGLRNRDELVVDAVRAWLATTYAPRRS